MSHKYQTQQDLARFLLEQSFTALLNDLRVEANAHAEAGREFEATAVTNKVKGWEQVFANYKQIKQGESDEQQVNRGEIQTGQHRGNAGSVGGNGA